MSAFLKAEQTALILLKVDQRDPGFLKDEPIMLDQLKDYQIMLVRLNVEQIVLTFPKVEQKD